jgi:hypothetical protein
LQYPSYASCELLPTNGTSRWTVHIDVDRAGAGMIIAGVSDATGRHAWGFDVGGDYFRRLAFDANWKETRHAGPPEGYPSGVDYYGRDRLQLVDDAYVRDRETGDCPDLPSTGLRINVGWSADEGALFVGCANGLGHPSTHAIRGFPKGAMMRPWCTLYGGPGDRVSIRGWLRSA